MRRADRRAGAGARTGIGAVAAAASLFAVLVLGTVSAAAQSYVCNDLAARLAVVSKRPPSSSDRWANAIAEQKQAIDQNRASLSRCGAPNDPRCAAIVQRGQQMAANLAMLERQHAQMGGAASAGSTEQGRIQALMAQMRCGEKPAPGAPPITATFDGSRSQVIINGARPGQPPTTLRVAAPGETPPGVGAAPPPPRQRSLLGMLFGGNSAGDPEPGQETGEQVIDPATAQLLSGSYRTLCVRTCDGYFFPISFNASQGRLRTDANVCKALCPASETRLYYHVNPGQEAEQAVAADGTGDQLTRLPNAFRYRNEVVPGCTCGTPDPRLLPPQAGGLKGARDAFARALDADTLPMPRRKPGADDDPETQALTVGEFSPEPVSPPVEPATVADVGPGSATAAAGAAAPPPPRVRTVGPKYFSDR